MADRASGTCRWAAVDARVVFSLTTAGRTMHRGAGRRNNDGATVTREVGYNITVSLYYRSVESGSLGDILPLRANASDGEGGTIYGAWTHDSRCTLYIDLQ